ncbi:MAG: tetratricopeptide repeat protein [Endomicrobiia bacterium]
MKKSLVLQLIFISIITFIVYSNVIDGKFLFDDEHFILRNVYITDWKYIKNIFFSNITSGAGLKDNFYRPLSTFIWLIINKTFGLNNKIFHIINILFHITNALLIYLTIFKIFNTKTIAFLASLFFALHPVNTEAVCYISGLGDPLSFVFVLLCIYLYILLREKNNSTKIFIFIISNILAILSKERGVVLPALLVITEIYFSIKEKKTLLYFLKNKSYLLTIYIFSSLLSILWFISRLTIFNFQNTFNFFRLPNVYSQNLYVRIFTFLNAFTEYLKLIIKPYPLYMERTLPVFLNFFNLKVIFGFSLIILIMILSIIKLKKYPEIFYSFGWFLICLLPTSGIIPINALFMEHWLYFSMFGVCIFISLLLKNYNWLKIFISFVLIIFAILTYEQTFIWLEPYTFFKHILKYNPNSVAANNNFAMAAVEKGELETAIFHYKKAISLDDTFPQPHHNLARIYVSLGEINQAIEEYNKALKIDPDFIYSHIDLFNIYTQLNKKDKANFHKSKIEEITKKMYE